MFRYKVQTSNVILLRLGMSDSAILHMQNFAQNWPTCSELAIVRRISKAAQKL